jgi:hypothetical protein
VRIRCDPATPREGGKERIQKERKKVTQILENAAKPKTAANDNETEFETARRHFVNVQAKALGRRMDRARFMTAWTMVGRDRHGIKKQRPMCEEQQKMTSGDTMTDRTP